MDSQLKVLFIDVRTGYSKIQRYSVGDFFGPVDLGLHLTRNYHSFNFGTGLLAGSIFPGSNRLIFTGNSPCWSGFYISSMGGAGLVFDNLGINLVAINNKANLPSILYLNRHHGEEIEIEIKPIIPSLDQVWSLGRKGIYGLMDYTFDFFRAKYETEPRILATGPAAWATDFGGIASVPEKKGKLSFIDTWAGRGGFGTLMLKEHGIAAVIYGGTHIDEDFRDRKVADEWFENRYKKKLTAKDLEATTKYRYDPNFETGGTFGVNYASIKGRMMAFNYQSIYWPEEKRERIHKEFILDHYLKQFNEETIKPKQQSNCGEPCPAVCKKMNNEFKKDYEPYQTMGPLSGIFDQRAAEKINHHADMLGFDAISVGGIVSWLMELLSEEIIQPEELGVSGKPKFSPDGFDVVLDSAYNAEIGIQLLDAIIEKKSILDLSQGARKFARKIARQYGKKALDKFVYIGFGRNGWVVPNQYWTPGALSPMAIMGKYYMNYSNDFLPPFELGKENANRMKRELMMDNLGICRFHRQWAEEMLPDIIEHLYQAKDLFLRSLELTASRINARNNSSLWESERNIDYVYSFLKRKKEIDKVDHPQLDYWLGRFQQDKFLAAVDYWYEIHKGIYLTIREFN